MANLRALLDDFTADVVTRLATEGAGAHGLTARVRGNEAYVGSYDRWVVHVIVEDDRVVLNTIDPETGAWRTQTLASTDALEAEIAEVAPELAVAVDQLTVHRLERGRAYRIARDFTDTQGNGFVAGEVLVFESLDHLPHDDGNTVRFAGRGMWIAGDSETFARFGVLVVPADD